MSTHEYVALLAACKESLQKEYGIISLRLFGSVARGEQHQTSDVDVFVETATPNPFQLMDAKEYMERQVGKKIDIVRNHKRLNPRLRQRIDHDGIFVF